MRQGAVGLQGDRSPNWMLSEPCPIKRKQPNVCTTDRQRAGLFSLLLALGWVSDVLCVEIRKWSVHP